MFKSLYRVYRLPILAGLLIGTSYIPFPPWALFFCLAPLWLFIVRSNACNGSSGWRRAFIGGWITQFVLNMIGFHWIAYTAVEFGHLPLWAGALVLLGFSATAHLYFPLSAALWVGLNERLRFKPVAGVFLLATLFAFFELVFPVLFPWHLGYTWLWAGFPGVQTADLIGFEGLNLITLAINALVVLAIQTTTGSDRRARVLARLRLVGLATGLFAVVNMIGFIRKPAWTARPDQPRANFLTIQGNIGNFEKVMAEKGRGYHRDIVTRYLTLSREGLTAHPNTDVLIWPETAYPDYLDDEFRNSFHANATRAFLRLVRKPLLTGGYSRDPRLKLTYNGLFALDASGEAPVPPHRKSVLLAFGEYFPGADYFPALMGLFPDLHAFGRGDGPRTMAWDQWRIGPQICYEGLYPWFSRELSVQGAEIFVNVTNDSWFGTPFEPQQHLYMTLARALEFRRPLVRSTNTGITTAILADGTILTRSPLHEEWFGAFEVPYLRDPPHVPFETLQPLWPWILGAMALVLAASGRRRRKLGGDKDHKARRQRSSRDLPGDA